MDNNFDSSIPSQELNIGIDKPRRFLFTSTNFETFNTTVEAIAQGHSNSSSLTTLVRSSQNC